LQERNQIIFINEMELGIIPLQPYENLKLHRELKL